MESYTKGDWCVIVNSTNPAYHDVGDEELIRHVDNNRETVRVFDNSGGAVTYKFKDIKLKDSTGGAALAHGKYK